MSYKEDGIGQYLSTYQRTETKDLVKVTDDNLMQLAQGLGATIDFEDGQPKVSPKHQSRFGVGDLIDSSGHKQHSYTWSPVETGDLINGGDLR